MSLVLLLVLATAPARPVSITEFCPRGFVALKGDACLAMPARFRPGKLIVYFHGMLAPSLKSPLELSLLGQAATARGYAVLAPRGESGACPWGDSGRHFCWPSDLSQLTSVGKVMNRLGPVFAETSKRLKARTLGSPLFAGFSNGGYFSSMLLSDTSVQAAGWAILHAGGIPGQEFAETRRGPVLLVSATDDAAQYPGMKALGERLKEQGWMVAERERGGAHEVRPDDVAAVLDFFESLHRQRD